MFRTRCCAWASCFVLSLALPFSWLIAEEPAKPTKETDAQALVGQALDNELAGDAGRREALLLQAAALDPQHPPAHWHLGQVRLGDDWMEAKAAMKAAAENPIAADYHALRDEAVGNAALELKLAQWCIKEKMPDRARLHFWRVVTNPKASDGQIKDAAKQLDLVSVGGTILTRDELKKEQEREKRIAQAIAKWRPILAQLQPAIDAGFDKKHDEAVQKLASIDDPAVIPAIETFLNSHREGFGEELVRLLVKFPHVESTRTLVRYAVGSPFLSVRERATSELKKRPLHDFVPTLLAGLVAPIQSQFRVYVDPQGNIRYQHAFAQQGTAANRIAVRNVTLRPVRIYQPQTTQVTIPANEPSRVDSNIWGWGGGRDLALLEVWLQIAERELQASKANLAQSERNQKCISVLAQTTGQNLGENAQGWWTWWLNYNQLHYPKPTYWIASTQQRYYLHSVIGGHQTAYVPWVPGQMSCFLAGTPVWTESGVRAIESVRSGDRVLSQDPDTGELCFKVVIGTTIRPPTEASKLTVNGETITTTLGHPLWVAGKGWEMAKHIKPGDQLHGIGGIVNVNDVQPLPNKAEAHNLVVDDFNTYFVGNCGMLVHDNTYRKPTRALLPGLIPGER